MSIRDVWQDYDCPSGMDFDLFGDELVYLGQEIDCPGCGRVHLAGVDVNVNTYLDTRWGRHHPELPANADELDRLRSGD